MFPARALKPRLRRRASHPGLREIIEGRAARLAATRRQHRPGLVGQFRASKLLAAPWPGALRREFQRQARALNHMHRLQHRLASVAARAEFAHARTPLTRPSAVPSLPLSTSRPRLWAWYKATGRSWAQFLSDHGPG